MTKLNKQLYEAVEKGDLAEYKNIDNKIENNYQRKLRKKKQISFTETIGDSTYEASTLIDKINIEDLLKTLSEKEEKVIHLRFFAKFNDKRSSKIMSFSEIARSLNISDKTAKSIYEKAITKLRILIEE